MTTLETKSQFFAYPALEPFEELDATTDVRTRRRQHFQRALDVIDSALAVGWASDRTNLASPELVATLPSCAPAAEAQDPSPALNVFTRVRDMLNLDDRRAAALVGISRNTPNNWRRGDRPKASTTRRLYELAAVLDLIATKEADPAAWSRSIASDGRSWLEVAAGPDGPAEILRRRRDDLLTPRPPTRLEVDSDDDAERLPASAIAAPGTVRRRPGPRRRPR